MVVNIASLNKFYNGKTVLVTGNTGFKGSWLSLWLHTAGANVTGIALDLPSKPALWQLLNLQKEVKTYSCDIRNYTKLGSVISKINPEIVFHLAAEPILLKSYQTPREVYLTNAIGTLNVLDSLRINSRKLRSIVNVTTDKVYQNNDSGRPFGEDDMLGGSDPYSSSKACSELITSAYRTSFFDKQRIGIATARAGNVIGGGDWGQNRLMPDIINALAKHQTLMLRHPNSVRPWQYVLDVLAGYLSLGAAVYKAPQLSGAYNFSSSSNPYTVRQLVERCAKAWGSDLDLRLYKSESHEDKLLRLDSSKSAKLLGWAPKTTQLQMIGIITKWYSAYHNGENMKNYSLEELERYIKR